MSRRLDELMREADPAGLVDQPPITAGPDDPLYLAILERRGDLMALDQKTKPTETPTERRRRAWVAAAAAFAVIAIAVASVLLLTQTGSDDTPPATVPPTRPPVTSQPEVTTLPEAAPTEPGEVIEYFYEVLLDDLDAAVALFAEDAVLVGPADANPLGNEPFVGTEAIRDFLRVIRAPMESTEATVIEVDGNTVTFDETTVQRSCFGGPRCVMEITGHVAVIEDGKIVSWKFGPGIETRPVDP